MTARRRLAPGPGPRDDGQITLLTLGFVVVAMLLIGAVVAATSVHLERQRLLALADVVALGAAESTAADGYFAPAPGDDTSAVPPLSDASVRRAAADYLSDHPEETVGLHRLTILAADSPDGRTAHVRLGDVAHPPLIGWVLSAWSGGITLQADSSARAS